MNNSTPLSKKEYIDAYGTDTGSAFKAALDAGSQTYGQSVKAANDDFYRSLMTYGQNAEALSGGGLTGTGVSDYGSHAAYAARQGSVATAGAAKQLAAAVATAEKKAGDQANAGSYAGYLSGYYSGQSAREDEISTSKQNTLVQILESGLTDPEKIAAYLKINGNFTDEEIASYSQEYAGLNANSAKTTAAQGIHNALVKEGVYDEATIRARYSTIPGITSEELDQYVANTVSVMSGVATNAATSNDNAKAAAKWTVWETLRTYDSVTPDTVKLALAATGVFADETEIEAAAQELYGQLNGSKTVDNGTFLEATAFYTDVLSKSGEATAKMLTEQKFGADVTSDVITKLTETQAADQQIAMQNEIKTFSDTVKALDTNGFAVAYGTDAEGNTVAVDMLDQLEWYKNNGYFDGNEEEYERMKGDIQTHNAEYLSSLYGMARNEWKAEKVVAEYGITLPENADDEDIVDAAVKAVKEEIIQKYTDGAISYEGARDILISSFHEDFSAVWESGNQLQVQKKINGSLGILLKAKEDADKLGEEQYYKEAISAFLSYWDIKETDLSILFSPKGNTQQAFGVEKSEIEYKNKRLSKGKNVIEMNYQSAAGISRITGDLPETVLDIYNYALAENMINYGEQIR